ncbi:hypothetical protein YC2023_032386 [Brassica napus]|uniref:(rape) hypothetical protein n=1 Tax=Brassica napus TaxID=3708 RepID=A0A816WFI3_BRANA|nr:unnamed protein product [Brassica napus]
MAAAWNGSEYFDIDVETGRQSKLIEDIDEYDGDDPLFPWIKCFKGVQEAFPPGGECLCSYFPAAFLAIHL